MRHKMNIDIRAELEDFPWDRARWTYDKLIAVSPFRAERTPSFFVNLETGGWHDSGAADPEWQSGNFTKLLAYLRGETIPETIEYLRSKYGEDAHYDEEEIPQIKPLKISEPQSYKPLCAEVLDQYRYRHPYLGRRGISEAVQRLMRIGYDKRSQAVTIPWFNADGTLGNVMYRSVTGKTFWYARGGRPIREMVYGIDVIYSRKIKHAVIVEAPIDAMTIMGAGFPAIAVGGTAFSVAKRDLILRSPIEEITVLRDNDGPGRMLQRKIIDDLIPHINVKVAIVPSKYGKDANDCAVNAGLSVLEETTSRSREVKRIKTFAINID